MKIVHLVDHDKYIDKVAGWIYKEFIENINPNRSFDDIVYDLKRRKKDDIPMTFIALEDGECLGTVTIFENDLKTTDLSPWLGSLYVDKDHRGRGIAKKLMAKVGSTCKKLGYKKMYLRTENTRTYYIENGWESILKTKDEIGLSTEVFEKDL